MGIFAGVQVVYGVTGHGGYDQYGTVIRLVPEEGGQWTEQVLYNFTGGADGVSLYKQLTIGPGALYGLAANEVYEITAH